VECVVLNACYSQVQAIEINQHINYVIGTKKDIRDDAALAFSIGFYEALGDGESIERAYEFGRNRIQLSIYGNNSTRERKLVPAYSETERKWIELPQHEVLVLLKKEPINEIVESPNNLPPDNETILQRPFIASSPYRGLKRFNAKNKNLFFGRERLINQLIEAVNQSNLVVVLGASGSGKSSVIRAGVLPQLELLQGDQLQSLVFTPNRDPFESIYLSLRNQEKDYDFSERDVEIVREGKKDTLIKTAELLKSKHSQWLIFIDQFEELFTICSNQEKRTNFIQGMNSIARSSDKSIKLILAMRSDFLEQLSPYPKFARIATKNINLIADMQPDQLRQAMEQPAAKYGVVFESGLVAEIIQDVQGQAGSLPLLQYTLDLLWKNDDLSDRTLNIETYRRLGGVSGALQKHVDEIYQQLPAKQQLAIKQILLRLVDIVGLEESDNLRTAVSRRAYKSEF
ncbi:MAG: ATP-binding protein, partial [Waterburya sp.]